MSLTSLPDLNRDVVLRLIPVGGIIAWWGTVAPDGYLLCNGASVSALDYPHLAAMRNQRNGTLTLPNIAAPVAGTAYIIKY